MRFIYNILVSMFFGIIPVYGFTPEFIKQIHAVRLTEAVQVDGVLSESIYQQPGVTKFYQREPNQGESVTEPTEVWVAYNDEALYVAARMSDSHPDSIYALLSRRDNDVGADMFGVGIDSYHDHRNGYYFYVTAAGTLIDGILFNDDWNDKTWDGVWEAQQKITEEGWTVEIRIPFSQIRFEKKDQYRYGINFERDIGRKKEKSFIVYTPRNESGFVSRFSDLLGIEHFSPPSRFEIRPYITTKQEFIHHEQGDPFHTGSKFTPDFGCDFKLGMGSNLTIDGAVNPDFGQVEVDPAVVNLSDVETYYDEKRPFFIEGMNIFSFGQGGVNSFWTFNWSNPNLFYSRRIGRSPQRGLPDNDFADVPQGTRILGAAKLTGKILDGWNIGVIEALTNREYAKIVTSGVHRDWEVEPLTSYTIGRVQRDLNDGKQGIGFLANVTHRFFKDDGVRSAVNSDAFLGGMDGWTALDDEKEYMISGWTAFSHIRGTRERILDLQQGWPHYYERPDADYISVDSTATSLEGYAGRFTLNRQKGRFVLNSSIGFVSPGFEPGDLGFINRADVINYHVGTGYKWNDPTDYYRYINIFGTYFQTLDFGGNTLWRGIWGRINYQFPNYHSIGLYYDYGFKSVSNRRARGGPLMLNLPAHEWGIDYYTDNRENYVGELYWYAFNSFSGERIYKLNTYFTLKPVSNLFLTLGPGLSTTFNPAQWIDDDINPVNDPLAVFTYGKRYLFADLNYKELSAQIRVNWTLSPNLSIQMFVQTLFSSGEYTNFKEFARPRSFDFNVFGKNGSLFADSTSRDGNRSIYLDPDGPGPAPMISMEHPNFSKVSLRGNAVLRWEYMPGSTLYLVWTQSRSDSETAGNFEFRRSFNCLGDAKSDNIFMLKIAYWLAN